MTVHRSLVVSLVVAAVVLAGCGKEDDDGDTSEPASSDRASASTDVPVVADDVWCDGWQNLVAVQALYVSDPNPGVGAQVLSAVDTLRELGAPESLDPSGYTEMTAVLDDVQASVDRSFTPSVVPSEPADVATGDEHEGDEHDDHGVGADEAPFGAWLAEYCTV